MKEELTVLGFLCQWCAYQGADLAGTGRLSYPANLRLLKVPCSGRCSSHLILKAFQEGADGVIVAGCHPGDCHYNSGNTMAEKRVKVLRAILDSIGIKQERLEFFHISASEGRRFSQIARQFCQRIKEIGPSPLKNERQTTKKG